MSEELKPCPFCGEIPDLPSGDGTQYEIECGSCAMAMASVQISDLMTIEERQSDPFTNYRYAEQYIERAKAEAIKQWNTRATPPAAQVQGEREAFETWYAGEYAGGNLECAKRYMTFEDGKYWQRDAQQSWAAWQARAALSAPPADRNLDLQFAPEWVRRAAEREQGHVISAGVLDAPPAAVVPDALDKARRHLSDAIEDVEDGKASAALPALREAAHYLTQAVAPMLPASEQQQAVDMAGWISCSDRLPVAPDLWVLVFADGAYNCMAYADGKWQDWTEASMHNIRIEEITHWMPLLAAPSAVVNQGVTTEAGNGGDE